MEKNKINKEKKKKSKLPLVMALCGVIGASCSVLALSQNFAIGDLFGSNTIKHDIIISSENVHDCTLLSASNTSVLQADNGDINISTDGHVQLPLFDSSYNKLKPKVYSLTCNLDFNSGGFVGFTFPFRFSSYSGDFPTLHIRNDNGHLGLYLVQTSHLYNLYNSEIKCFSEDSILAYADISDITSVKDLSFSLLVNSSSFTVKVNNQNVEWLKIKNCNVSGKVLSLSGLYSYSSIDSPICLDVYDVSANVKDLKIEIYDKGE